MKTLFLLPALIVGLGLTFASTITAQTFMTLHSFTGFTDSDGAAPNGLILLGNTLFGTAYYGGSSDSGNGTVFAFDTNGTVFTHLHSFTATYYTTNSDGVPRSEERRVGEEGR